MKIKDLKQKHFRQPFVFVDDINKMHGDVKVPVYLTITINRTPELRVVIINMYDFKENWFSPDDDLIMNAEIRFLNLPGK